MAKANVVDFIMYSKPNVVGREGTGGRPCGRGKVGAVILNPPRRSCHNR